MAAFGSTLRKCREECDMELVDLAAGLIQHGFVSGHFTTESELAQLLSDIEAGEAIPWQREELLDFQLYCVSCFGIRGLRVSREVAAERPEEAPQAGYMLRAARVAQQYSLPHFAALLMHAGMRSFLIETREDLVDILDHMEHGALCPFLGHEAATFAEALHEVLPDESASAVTMAQATDLLRQILPRYW